MDDKEIHKLIDMYRDLYFTYDKPVPFKDDLMVYPVTIQDYYNFYCSIDIMQLEKNQDPTGVGIPMSNLGYLIYKSRQDTDEGKMIASKIIQLLELVFHVKNGIRCSCDEDGDTFLSQKDLYNQYCELKLKFSKDHPEKTPEERAELTMEQLQEEYQVQMDFLIAINNLRLCPKCGKIRSDIISYKKVDDKKEILVVDGVEIEDDDFDVLRRLICFQNMPDFSDEYIDPKLKKELELKAKLENPNAVSPTLEKQITCIVASTNYTYETIQNLTLRHLVQLLRVIDAKLHYMVYRQAEATGMVTFKNDAISHWIYSDDKTSVMDKVQTLDGLKDKMKSVASM